MSAPDLPPVPLPQPNPSEIAEDSKALSEQAALAAGVDLSSRKKLNEFNDLKRYDRASGHKHVVTVCGMWFGAAIFLGMFGVWSWHMAAPHAARFLDGGEVEALQRFLFSGLVGGLLTRFSGPLLK